MATPTTAVQAGASLELQPDSKCVVSFWYIPGGCNYDQARVIEAFFADVEAGREFADQNRYPPEMAQFTLYPVVKDSDSAPWPGCSDSVCRQDGSCWTSGTCLKPAADSNTGCQDDQS